MKSVCIAIAALGLGACASLQVQEDLREVQQLSANAGAIAQWQRDPAAQQAARSATDALLAQPLSQGDAVGIALTSSPAMQAVLSQAAMQSANATQSARLPNPVFAFERLLRREGGEVDKDISRMLSFSLSDFLLLPLRRAQADATRQQVQLATASSVVQTAGQARLAWVQAVAAAQTAQYTAQVQQAAEAGAELARRMQSAGNYSALQRAREQAFYADATAQHARALQQAQASRETLIRVLGLPPEQASRLRLPAQLPALPASAPSSTISAQPSFDARLDMRIARFELQRAQQAAGGERVARVIDGLHLAAVRNSETGRAVKRGWEVEFPIPVLDWGDARRAAAQAAYLASVNRTAATAVNAQSNLREASANLQSAWDLARHYRDEVVPLRKRISDEMLLKCNGMLIGVFDLLADAREQAVAVTQSIAAQRDYWLADAAWQAALLGVPQEGPAMQIDMTDLSGGAKAH